MSIDERPAARPMGIAGESEAEARRRTGRFWQKAMDEIARAQPPPPDFAALLRIAATMPARASTRK